jgi:hypothetical protein
MATAVIVSVVASRTIVERSSKRPIEALAFPANAASLASE